MHATTNLVQSLYTCALFKCIIKECVFGQQGIELGARAMVESGADMLYTTQPQPNSEIQISRDKTGRIINPEELEAWYKNVHSQGDYSLVQ
jgi:hypothetical protein